MAFLNDVVKSFGNDSELRSLVERIDFSTATTDQSNRILAYFVDQAMRQNSGSSLRIIIDVFDQKRAHIDPLPCVTYLIINPYVSESNLRFAIQCFPNKTCVDYYVDLVNMPNDKLAIDMCNRMESLFPSMRNEDWILLRGLTDDEEDEEYPNPRLRKYFESQIIHVPRPPWVKSYPEVDLPTMPDIPSVSEAVNQMISDLKDQLRTVEQVPDGSIQQGLATQYAISTVGQKMDMLRRPAFDSTSIFREFGPVNTMCTSFSEDPDDPCGKYGGCRMLTCTEFEADSDDDWMMMEDHYVHTDWYRGVCDQCRQTIQQRHYALRIPLRDGGWKGCYCSVDCLNQQVNHPVIRVMVDRMIDQLETIGIRDR